MNVLTVAFAGLVMSVSATMAGETVEFTPRESEVTITDYSVSVDLISGDQWLVLSCNRPTAAAHVMLTVKPTLEDIRTEEDITLSMGGELQDASYRKVRRFSTTLSVQVAGIPHMSDVVTEYLAGASFTYTIPDSFEISTIIVEPTLVESVRSDLYRLVNLCQVLEGRG